MPATLTSLLADRRFGLRSIAVPTEVLARAILWAHSSDLPDPTPWLEPGQLLLTNGAQFTVDPDPVDVTAYVQRLSGSEIGALAFATQVVHDGVPPALVQSCANAGLPLLEVADRTPFISIIRHVADTIAAEQRQRLEWSLAAQRALARAALKPDGLAEVLHELERRLDCWVALFDATGSRVPVRGSLPMPATVQADVEASVRSVLTKGHRAGMRLSTADGAVTLQTIGQRDRLRGVLAVGTAAPLDAAGTDLVASVIGLASISVEQSRVVEVARQDLRSGLLELLLAGSVEIARATARRIGDKLPSEPIRVAVMDHGTAVAVVREDLARENDRGVPWFTALRGEELVVVLAARDAERLEALLEPHSTSVGLSEPGPWGSLSELLSEARRALSRSTTGGVTRFESMLGDGMVGLIEDRGGVEVARRVLAPLDTHPNRDVLLETMRVWLRHGCAWGPAARELGVHRHTLRNRTGVVEGVLGIDLSGFAGRAELWLSLQLGDA